MRHIPFGGDFARTGNLMMIIGADIVVTVVVNALLLVMFDMPVRIVFNMGGKIFLAVDIDLFTAFGIFKPQFVKALALVRLGFEGGAGFLG
ncbi:hypothetical protein PSI17_16325 [Xenorhabdus sp. IM139775]|nr:hypothetical protein [Xenorhabdus sp. IM139775]MDC9595111.1 hypothetical protein [Xenorhabdus sp. IM139775]